ncbi:VanZ family protein [Ignatzschineria cameli]|uniref:VanZ-like domain-containing protein n=1 Tax=Ignatzschineria cameli TaxID=2182793 RepID=A0A2U2AKY4_9GAMM|nr:VanZ family protein [Ignatzschineria cameli]PWD83824.1 hypothetical protein DC077_09030 [Ignatzschineria cameli]PWD86094.1 hypothetical protein DC080_04905 [Ignatzschineria cameli]PWD88395.1 hypothetical protein DC079_09770 [Ignatzschineria cameli]PWD88901.1 hypothetical protein DC081_09940 [Ignatzschineria cameli]PWD89618.1 hypothetical protein DC078_09715 [Ignatzschineria cameli]
MKGRFYKVVTIIWFLIMNIIFFYPGENIPFLTMEDEWLDNWLHFGAFATLTGLVLRGIHIENRRRERVTQEYYCHFCFFYSARCMLLLIAYFALLSELIQGYFIPGKTREFSDLFVDFAGILTAWGISSLLTYWERSIENLAKEREENREENTQREGIRDIHIKSDMNVDFRADLRSDLQSDSTSEIAPKELR